MNNTVIGVFDDVYKAEDAAQQLVYHGFDSDRIDISATNETRQLMQKPQHKEGLSKFFSNLFGETDEASNYSAVAERGAVVTVHAPNREDAELAARILDQYGAVDANKRGMRYREKGYTEPDANYRETDAVTKDKDSISNEASIPVIEEQMEVSKKEIESGSVQIRSRIIERPVEENLRLRVEKVYVERTPANRAATEAEMASFKEGVITATEKEEIPVVKKEARVVEDIKLKKEVKEREQTIRGSVRKQDIDIDKKKKDREPYSDADESNI